MYLAKVYVNFQLQLYVAVFHGLHTHQTCHPLSSLDALDQRVQQCVPVPINIQQLRTAIEEERDNIPQATINSLINSM
jgi:hypothetical protein